MTEPEGQSAGSDDAPLSERILALRVHIRTVLRCLGPVAQPAC
jgi:hypothetical protein